MSKNKRTNPLFQFLLGLLLCLLIISASVTVTLNFRPLYYLDISLLGIEQMSGMSRADIIKNYDALIDYNSLFNHDPLEFPTLTMSETGRIHFEEVKKVFDLFGYMALILLLPVIIGMIISHRHRSGSYLITGGILGILIPAALGALIYTNWDMVFVKFHEIVFRNDYWIFDASTDPVIMMLPDTFFMHCAIMIIALIIIASILCIIIGIRKALRR